MLSRASAGILVAVFLAAVSTVSPGARADDETDLEIVTTYSRFYFSRRDFSAARKLLQENLKPEITPTGAPHRGTLLYQLADALNRDGDTERARSTLNEAAAEETVRSSALEALKTLRPRQPLPPLAQPGAERQRRTEWSFSTGVETGYDSNVLLASDASLATASRSNTASPRVSVLGRTGNVLPLGNRELGSQLSAVFDYHTNPSAQRFNALAGALHSSLHQAGDPRPGGFSIRGENRLEMIFLNPDGLRLFSVADTLGPRVSIHHDGRSKTQAGLPLYFRHFPREPGEDAANDRSGFGLRPALHHQRRFSFGTLALGLTYERHLARGVNYRASSLSIPVHFERPFARSWQLSASVEPAWVRFSESTADRSDRNLGVSVGASRQLSTRSTGSLDYSFRRNLSNVGTAVYSKHSISILFGYDLL